MSKRRMGILPVRVYACVYGTFKLFINVLHNYITFRYIFSFPSEKQLLATKQWTSFGWGYIFRLKQNSLLFCDFFFIFFILYLFYFRIVRFCLCVQLHTILKARVPSFRRYLNYIITFKFVFIGYLDEDE